MKRTIKNLYATVIINLVLWLAAFGAVMSANTEMIKPLVIAGLVFAAVAQHWAYYAIRKASVAPN